MCQFLFGFLVVFIFGGAICYESLRWMSMREECDVKRLNHHKLLASDICKKDYGESVEAACAKANIELRTSSIQCASSEWWKRGEIYNLYTRLTESTTYVILLILIPVIYTIHKIFDAYQQRNMDDRTERMLTLYGYSREQQQQPPPPYQMPRLQQHRRGSQFIYNPNDDRAF